MIHIMNTEGPLRIVLFGGSFDPIHLGHTTVASYAIKHLKAHQLILIPAARSPLKGQLPKASAEDRLNMIRLAITGYPDWSVSDSELTRPQPSYTLDTVRYFRSIYGPYVHLYWLIGADCAAELPSWYRIEELLGLCTIVTTCRPGSPRPDYSSLSNIWPKQYIERLQQHIIDAPLVDISSTVIRQRLAEGKDVTGMLDPAVLQYIRQHGLYT